MSAGLLAHGCFGGGSSDDDDVSPGDDDSSSDDASGDDIDRANQLFAAAGTAIISPTPENHPETIYLGGIIPSRVGTGVHDDLKAAALALSQGGRTVVLVSLDFLGFSRTRIREIQDRLAEHGLPKENILIASTHTHEAPDTLGVFGPDFLHSGVSRTYMNFVQDRITDLILDVWARMVPVTMKAATATVNDPHSNFPTLMADFRAPEVTVDWVSAAQFTDLDGNPVATLVNWHAHPEVMIESMLVSADFPQYLRQRMNGRIGGECVYISGAVGGLASPTGVDVQARDEDDRPILGDQMRPTYLRDGSWDKTRSLGFVIADIAAKALEDAETEQEPQLRIEVRELPMPVQSPTFILAYFANLLEVDDKDLIKDRPEFCGWVGCSSDRLAAVRLGSLEIITSPGETFPETLISRPRSTVDFGSQYGTFDFPPIWGIRPYMNAPVPMHMALCGNEIGYLIPETDYHPHGHPDYYEEDLCFGRRTETLYREAAIDLLTSMK